MRKRGELLGTPFVMIFALVVGALTLAGGLYYIFKLMPLSEQISIAKEVNDFKAVIRTYYYLEEGNSKLVKINLPPKAKNICFYDSGKGWKPGTGPGYPPDFQTKISFYQKFFQSFTAKNMFVFPTEAFEDSAFEIQYLNLQSQTNNPICVRNGQNIIVASMGDHVEVKAG